jgi:hypothetical protein
MWGKLIPWTNDLDPLWRWKFNVAADPGRLTAQGTKLMAARDV